MQTRLADLERLRKMAVKFVSEHADDEEPPVTETETEYAGDLPDLLEDEELPQAHPCPCGHPDAMDGSMEHVLAHNRDEVSGAVTVTWAGADPQGVGYPAPQLFVVTDVHSGVQLYPARITIMSDLAASLAIVDVTELLNADGVPIRSDTRGKMGVFTDEYKEWNATEHGEDEQFLGDKYVSKVSRFVLASMYRPHLLAAAPVPDDGCEDGTAGHPLD